MFARPGGGFLPRLWTGALRAGFAAATLLPVLARAQVPTPPPPYIGTLVTPHDSLLTSAAGALHAVLFTVHNITGHSTTFTITCDVGGVISSCYVDVPTLTLGIGASSGEDISVTDAGTGSGTVAMFATDGSYSDSGWYHVTFTGPPTPVLTRPRQNDSVFNRGHCLTTSRESMTWSCGDAMYFLQTPGYTTLDRDRSMTLVYASNTAEPLPVVATNVTIPSGPVPDRIHAILTVNDTVRTSVNYTAWSGSTRQVALNWNALSQLTGAYPYTLTVYTIVGTDSASASVNGLTTVVNRSASPYGNGWEWLGVERLVRNQPVNTTQTNLLWVDGDGSTRFYRRVGSSNTWMSAKDDGQDSITFASNQYTLTTRHGVQVIFDTSGRHIQTKNRAGQVTSFAWLNATQLDSVLLPPSGSGKAFKLQYATGGRLSGVRLDATNARNIVDTVDASSGAPQLTSWVWPDGTRMHFSYNGGHRLTKSVFSGQDSLALAYDTLALVKQSTVYYKDWHGTAQTSVTNYTPWQELGFGNAGGSSVAAGDTSTAVTTIDGPPIGSGFTTVFHVDQWGAPVAEKDPYGHITSYVRADTNAPGLVSEIDFPNNRKVSMYYNRVYQNGALDSLIDRGLASDSFPRQKTSWLYADGNDRDSPSQVTAPDGTVAHFGYNTMDLTAADTDSRGHVTAFAYNTSGSLEGQLTSITEQSVPTWIQHKHADSTINLVTSLSYNTLGNSVRVNNPAGGTALYYRDADGRLIGVTDPMRFKMNYYYDAMDRDTLAMSSTTLDSAVAGCLPNEFVCAPNLLDNLASNQVHTRRAYTLGRLTEIDDARNVSHKYSYDERGLMLKEIDEQGKADLMNYDAAGEMTTRVTRKSDTLTFSYDSLGRETRWIMPFDTVSTGGELLVAPADTVTSTYDNVGNLLVHKNRHGDITRTYFSNGTVRTEADHPGETFGDSETTMVSDSVHMAYNTGGRLDTLSWGDSDRVSYSYNTAGDLNTLTATWRTSAAARTESYQFKWDTLGRRRQIIYPYFFTSDTLHYDRLGVLRELGSTTSATVMPNRFRFSMTQDSVDVRGRPLHQGVSCIGVYGNTDPASPCGDWVPWENTTTYFRTGAIAIQSPRDRNGTVVTDSFTYDASGNRTKDIKRLPALLTTTLFYPALSNRVDSAQITLAGSGSSTTYYQYYPDGARRNDFNGGLTNVNGYQYDAAGRMVGYTHNLAVAANSCLYDPEGRMYQSCGGLAFSLLGPDAIHDATNSWFYVHAPGIDEPLLAIKRVPNTYLAQARLQIVSDGTGQLVSIADSSGGFNSLYAGPDHYTPGTWATAGMTSHAQTFDPQRLSSDSGAISSFRTRQYDPGTGTWLQEDHAGLAGGVNLYEYNGNDPNSFRDPTGTCPRISVNGKQVEIDANLEFTNGTPADATAVRQGIAEYWSGKIAGYKLSVNLSDTSAPAVEVTITGVGGNQILGAGAGTPNHGPGGVIHLQTTSNAPALGRLAAHEFGHVMDLPDVSDPRALMHSNPNGPSVSGTDVTNAIRNCGAASQQRTDSSSTGSEQ
jgi:RHS repeat-associated protein